MSSLASISQQATLYWGAGILVTGLLGGATNCLVFLSLRTFRHSSCAVYLTVMSFFNIGQLIMSVFSRIMITGFGIDWTQTSLVYCKFRVMFLHLCSLMSFTCMCLATIDQFMVTSSRRRWQKFSNVRLACALSFVSTLVWLLHEIAPLIYFDLVRSSSSARMTCTNTNTTYQRYVTYVYVLILTGILPIVINVLFGSLAYYNVRRIPYRTVPVVRREMDKQLTSMVLVQVVYSFCVVVPFIIMNILAQSTTLPTDPTTAEGFSLANTMTGNLFYMHFVGPFYIYVCTSKRFRQQLLFVIFRLRFREHQEPIIVINQIGPFT